MKVPRLGSDQSCSCRPTPQPQQCQIPAASATYTTAHGNVGSLTHWARPEIESSSSWILVGFVTAEPQPEFLKYLKCRINCDSTWGHGQLTSGSASPLVRVNQYLYSVSSSWRKFLPRSTSCLSWRSTSSLNFSACGLWGIWFSSTPGFLGFPMVPTCWAQALTWMRSGCPVLYFLVGPPFLFSVFSSVPGV